MRFYYWHGIDRWTVGQQKSLQIMIIYCKTVEILLYYKNAKPDILLPIQNFFNNIEQVQTIAKVLNKPSFQHKRSILHL